MDSQVSETTFGRLLRSREALPDHNESSNGSVKPAPSQYEMLSSAEGHSDKS